MEMHELMSKISDGTLPADAKPNLDICILQNLNQLNWIKSRYMWASEALVGQLICLLNQSLSMNHRNPAI